METTVDSSIQNRIQFLKSISIFSDVEESLLFDIALLLKPVHVKSEQSIYKEGDSPNGLFLVEYGCVQLHSEGVEFSILSSGSFFGEQALLLDDAAMLSASAVTDTQLLYLDKASFHSTLSQEQSVLRAIIFRLVSRLKSKSILENNLLEKNTEIRKQNCIIEEKTEELKALLETKDQLLSIIAHDLKNPFNMIMGLSDMLLSAPDMDSEKRQMFTERINHSVKDVYGLLENLLSWGRTQTGRLNYKPERLSLLDVAENNVALYANVADAKNIRLLIEMDSSDAYADAQMIDTVVRNLLGNAIKFTSSGYIQLSCEDCGNHVQFAVTDSGVGIPSHKIDDLLDSSSNYSTRGTQNEKGTGLGLSLCKQFIEINQGELSVTSATGVGSTFMFTLPKYDSIYGN